MIGHIATAFKIILALASAVLALAWFIACFYLFRWVTIPGIIVWALIIIAWLLRKRAVSQPTEGNITL